MSWVENKKELQAYAKSLDKSIILLPRDHWSYIIWDWIILICTFSLAKNWIKNHRKNFAIGMGPFHFYPNHWSSQVVKDLIPHEAGHTREFRRWGLGIHPILGFPLMILKYVFVLFPIYFAIGRVHSEIFAEHYSWEVKNKQFKLSANYVLYKAERLANNVSSSKYLWSFPKTWTLKWYLSVAKNFIRKNDLK